MLFKNKRVTIMGLGLHGGGVGVAKFFYKKGTKVLVTDLKTRKKLKESLRKLKGLPIKYVLGKHRKEDFINADLIIKNPAVHKSSPYLKIARRHKIPIKTDIGIFFDLCKAPIIGVTGTKGKSTVATLIYKFLRTKYPKTILAGNIGVSPLELLNKAKKGGWVVLELSSFELEDLRKSPKIAVITNIFPDHLDRYKNMKEYIEAKKPIFKFQKKSDILVLNYDDPTVRNFSKSAKSRVFFYSCVGGNPENRDFSTATKDKEKISQIKNIKLKGEHNLSNILAAISVAKLLKIPASNIEEVLSRFKGVSSRQQFIREVKGVKYFNDTTATMPNAAIEAIKTFKERFPKSKIVLICGGADKNLNYKNLAKEIQKNIDTLVLFPGTASDKLKEGLMRKKIKITPANSMETAVKKASKIAGVGDIVLLSPGAASFNMFKNEFDRGEQFNKAVRKLR